ncbi:MAG TPA: DUF378 domain-containing protein [Candidatus Gastranaerophilales bacterium]|nr:DUF378 domain-containing protein [Candidatus Gastranaerophilales bacterium]
MRNLQALTYVLVIIGAINWGLIGLFSFDLVSFLFGEMTALTRIIYSLVGISAITHLLIATSSYKLEKEMAH